MGHRKGGLSTKIQASVAALGNPTGFRLRPGQACDREGAEALRPALEAPIVLADKGYHADERVLQRLAPAGKRAVIPPQRSAKGSPTMIRTCIKPVTGSRISSAGSNRSAPLPPATTRRHETSSPPSISLLPRLGLMEDTP
jgi:hypothetical protein